MLLRYSGGRDPFYPVTKEKLCGVGCQQLSTTAVDLEVEEVHQQKGRSCMK
ncbi:hypothetical protein AMATHDRAFT_4032 [Amanita thiersii Skay4041]|uniref:Uncharacterized protein n=1 Tax=Amanita thiersii Skay4041 TaxID=703135 RepID=A0A2A9NIG6_9AGAR|nr:hypothetical protein AMATHDRAFT_4032 [Amanita thiersii Skay4041]